jgi:prephenate dehydrogenase
MPAKTPESPNEAQIAIIGLGWMGQTLGHALQGVKTSYRIIGHDREPAQAKSAREAGAIDRADWNLIAAVEAADLIFLCEPLDELCETLELIATEVRPGTLITDTAPVKNKLMRLAHRVVPEGVSFIGGHPIVRPAAGSQDQAEAPEALAARFDGATWCLCPLPSASDAAMRVLGNLVSAIGAKSFFVDPGEHDALLQGAALMPYLSAMAILRHLGQSPSSRDLERLGGTGLLDMASLTDEERVAFLSALSDDRPSVVAWLDQAMGAMFELREALVEEGDRAEQLLAEAELVRHRWLFPPAVDPATGEALDETKDFNLVRQLLFGRLGQKRPEAGNGR